jgi:allophanate hydrolase subunit 1
MSDDQLSEAGQIQTLLTRLRMVAAEIEKQRAERETIIIDLHARNVSLREIEPYAKISFRTVGRIIERHTEKENIIERKSDDPD